MHRFRSLAAAFLATTIACADAGDSPYEELAITCNGKCDGFDSITSLIADAKKLDLGDLINVTAGFATDGLNDALEHEDYGEIQLDETELYTTADRAGDDLTLENLDDLVSGLGEQFGESSLTTEVNAIRADHLRSSNDIVFAESAFEVEARLDPSWSFETSGFGEDMDIVARLGFATGVDLEARVVTAHDSELDGLTKAPLQAAKQMRGFVLPRGVEDIRAMKPGESYALSGTGQLGVNLGVGVPVLLADPIDWLAYKLVFTAAARTLLSGELDVQVVRVRGDEVVVDVGLQKQKVKGFNVGLHDGWGISGLLSFEFDVSGIEVDLGRIVEKALAKRLNRHLALIDASVGSEDRQIRMSVARLRFSLDGNDPLGARDVAIAQALKGDVRLAQALAARADSGVVAEFDLLRSGASTTSHAGIEIFGMRFFREKIEQQGSVVVQTPGGTLALMFDSLHREGGWFFSSHGYTRVGLAGLVFDPDSAGVAEGQTNLFIQTEEGDKSMERDKVMDQLDGLILALAGRDALIALEEHGNALERYVLEQCPVPGPHSDDNWSETCNIELIENDPKIGEFRDAGMDALEDESDHLDDELFALVLQAGELRLAAQSIEDPRNTGGTKPKASMVLDYRLDDNALRRVLLEHDGADLKKAVIAYMEAAQVRRTEQSFENAPAKIAEKANGEANAMAEEFDDHAKKYAHLLEAEFASIEGLGEIGANAIEIRFSVDGQNRPQYEDAVARSIAKARSDVVADLFDDLQDEADELDRTNSSQSPPHAEQMVAFALLTLAPQETADVRFDFDTENEGGFFSGSKERYNAAGFTSFDTHAKGSQVAPIDGGLFDIDALIDFD